MRCRFTYDRVARTLCPPDLAHYLSRPKRGESRRDAELELELRGTIRVTVSCESPASLNFSLHVELRPDFYLLYASPLLRLHFTAAHPNSCSSIVLVSPHLSTRPSRAWNSAQGNEL